MEDQKELRIENLYKLRTKLLQDGLHWMSDEILEVENEIDKIEELPSFDEVIKMISTGRMKSVFK